VAMRKYFFTLVTLGALLLGFSCALHAENFPETPYDESQGTACGHSSLFLTRVLHGSVQRAQANQKSASPLLSGSAISSDEIRVEKEDGSKQPDRVTSAIHPTPLRC
jgi:hypothetical protein